MQPPLPAEVLSASTRRREGDRVSRISTDEQNRATTPGSRRGAHGAAKAIKAILGVTAGETRPRVGRQVISHGGCFFLQTIISPREL